MFKVGDSVIWIGSRTAFVGAGIVYHLIPHVEFYTIVLCSGGNTFYHLHHKSWPVGINTTGYTRDNIAHACFFLDEIS